MEPGGEAGKLNRETPMIRQYNEIKAQNRDRILLFRVGDFYEMFFDDAKVAAKALEITLTSRETGKGNHVPLAGFPYHALNTYLGRLINRGHKVAICEQVEDPKQAKGIVRREIVRIITPGTVTEASLLDEKSNNYLVSVYAARGGFGLAAVDVSTGEFVITESRGKHASKVLVDELCRLQPAEIIMNDSSAYGSFLKDVVMRQGGEVAVTHCPDKIFAFRKANESLLTQYGVNSLGSLGCEGLLMAVPAAGAALHYLKENQQKSLKHLNSPRVYFSQGFMVLDAATRRNLELTRTIREEKKYGSLLWVLDRTRSSPGTRLLRRWLEQPLLDKAAINRRLDAVDELVQNVVLLEDVSKLLDDVYDLERLMGRIHCDSANARDLVALRQTLDVLPSCKEALLQAEGQSIKNLAGRLPVMDPLASYLQATLVDDPPLALKEGGLLRDGFHAEVDRLRNACRNGKDYILGMEQRERERTGIKSLKIGYNRVFGYYIEVKRANVSIVPDDYLRKQTLANAERYITPELKEYEELVLGAGEKICELEYAVFQEIREEVKKYTEAIQDAAAALAELDVYQSLARAARDYRYVRPYVNDEGAIEIYDARHPVVERVREELFVPNDICLDTDNTRIILITGPNMAGKSTYMRQAALIVLMAQVGSFVPAREARIGLVDRIFTRIGAADDLVGGQSTFMIEMNEVAAILSLATNRSMVLLDEVGRGTSTLDGISIARSVVEYLYHKIKARTLFATHYHELTTMAEEFTAIKNFFTAVKERGDDVVFLHKVIPGCMDRSFGIQVARLAGLPPRVISRAQEILGVLETPGAADAADVAATAENQQLRLFMPDPELSAIFESLENTDMMTTTPLEAMQLLYRLQQMLKKGNA